MRTLLCLCLFLSVCCGQQWQSESATLLIHGPSTPGKGIPDYSRSGPFYIFTSYLDNFIRIDLTSTLENQYFQICVTPGSPYLRYAVSDNQIVDLYLPRLYPNYVMDSEIINGRAPRLIAYLLRTDRLDCTVQAWIADPSMPLGKRLSAALYVSR